MWFIQILPRTDGDNTRRVDGLVAAEIVGANMVEVDRLPDARHLVDVAQETMQVQVVADTVLVALKVGDIDRIKANQRGPQANVRFRQAIARQVAMLAQDLFQAFQRFKHLSDRFVIRFLAGGETGLIDTVIDVVVNPAVQFINFLAQLHRIVISGTGAVRVKRGIEHADDFRRLIADNRLVFLVPQHRHGHAPGVVRIGAQIELVEEIVVIKIVAGRRWEITVKRPAVFQHQRVDHGNRNEGFETFKLAYDQRAVGPRAGEGNIKMITIFLSREAAFAARAWCAVGGQPVTEGRNRALKATSGGFGVIPYYPNTFSKKSSRLLRISM